MESSVFAKTTTDEAGFDASGAHLNTVLKHGRDALLRVRECKSSKPTFIDDYALVGKRRTTGLVPP
jgi:hypothetical protein